MRKHCICGCGNKLPQQKSYGRGNKKPLKFYKKRCRYRYIKTALLYGSMPLGEVFIKRCTECDQEFLNHNQIITTTCSMFSDRNCNKIKQAKSLVGNQNAKTIEEFDSASIETKVNRCHPDSGECAKYSECFGSNCTGYELERSMPLLNSAFSSRCAINL